jgi:hypothetical protein
VEPDGSSEDYILETVRREDIEVVKTMEIHVAYDQQSASERDVDKAGKGPLPGSLRDS